MGFKCDTHGWQHLLNPCPLCVQTTVSGSTTRAVTYPECRKDHEHQENCVVYPEKCKLHNLEYQDENGCKACRWNEETKSARTATQGGGMTPQEKIKVILLIEAIEILCGKRQPEGDLLVERSPTKDPACHRAWLNLNERVREVKELIPEFGEVAQHVEKEGSDGK